MSQVDIVSRRWYREPWPWLLMAAPAASIALGFVMWTLAVRTDDGVVAEDYYKRGLTINQKLRQTAPRAVAPLAATVRVAENGDVRASVQGSGTERGTAPTIRLRLSQPSVASRAIVVVLARDASGDYVGTLDRQAPGRWIVSLESDAWRLPTTAVAWPLTEIRLGAATERSSRIRE